MGIMVKKYVTITIDYEVSYNNDSVLSFSRLVVSKVLKALRGLQNSSTTVYVSDGITTTTVLEKTLKILKQF